MASVVYKSLSSLSPIELRYQYYKDEKLTTESVEYVEGYSLSEAKGLTNYQDIAINRDSCLVLTSTVDLDNVFSQEQSIYLNKQPSTIILQPRNSDIYYVKHSPSNNTLQQTLTSSSPIFIQPIDNSKEVELLIEGKYIQVDEEYPYVVKVAERSLDPESIHRQRFLMDNDSQFVTFRTKTNSGYRYLAFNNDNILRAVGLLLNDTILNDYVFKYYSVTNTQFSPGFIPTNDWVTYYFDVESQTKNKTVEINKDFQKVPTNLLIDFPIEKAVETGVAYINIANLKTQVTPAGGPAPTDNSYDKEVITKN